jgi:anti-sigma factor RsiW
MTDRDELTCRDFIDVILAWLDDELEPAKRALFAEHLAECVACEDYLRSYRLSVKLGKRAFLPGGPDDAIPADVPEELVQAVLAARRQG